MAINTKGLALASGVLLLVSAYLIWFANLFPIEYLSSAKPPPELDKVDYNARMLSLAHLVVATSTATTTDVLNASSTQSVIPISSATTSVSVPGRLWPVPTVYPNYGALLPYNRIVAYYGNFYSKRMGVLGEYSKDDLLAKLASTTEDWISADPTTPVLPAIHYIAVVAQSQKGKDGTYRLRMPDDQIDKAMALANELHGILFLDVQVGRSTLQAELPALAKYLAMPQVHLGIDPEFSMKSDNAPGTVIGTFDADDINYAVDYLASLVRANNLPPKILVIHRFTKTMVTNYEKILPLPDVQIVMDMDGWGPRDKKRGTYNSVIVPEPVQFTGVKLFYHADLKPPSTGLLTPEEVLSLTPAPIYIQYQ